MIKNGLPIAEQDSETIEKIEKEVLPNIKFSEPDECDKYGRPHKWTVGDITLVATYFTNNQNLNFNQFLVYENGNI